MKKFIFKGLLGCKFCGSLRVRGRSSRAKLARILIESSSSLKSQLDLKFELVPSLLESSSSRARAGSSSARLGSFTAISINTTGQNFRHHWLACCRRPTTLPLRSRSLPVTAARQRPAPPLHGFALTSHSFVSVALVR
ncbi:hypothetical protein Hdeb2414_s0009g00321131 [Helianthus debilis subsp. tardiflorus]